MESSYTTTTQPVIDVSNKSGGGIYAAYADTPYSSRQVDRCERSLHHTNRSQYERDEDHHKQWFVTRNPHLRECYAEFLGTFVMISFGTGVNNQVVLSEEQRRHVAQHQPGVGHRCAHGCLLFGRSEWCAPESIGHFGARCLRPSALA